MSLINSHELQHKRFILHNCSVLDTLNGKLIEGQTILIDHGKIEEISSERIQEANLHAIDMKNMVVMPGLIDCHVHCMASNLNLGFNAALPNIFATLKALPILEGMLMRGFTTVRDAGGADWSLSEATRTGLVKGPIIFPAGKALSQTGGHGDFRPRSDVMEPCACSQKVGSISRVVDGVDAIRLAVREEIQKGATQIKIMASGGIASPNDPIHFLGFSEDEIRAAVEEAGNAGTYVMAHAYTPEAIIRAVRCGVRTIEHGSLINQAAAEFMAAAGAFLVPTTITFEALAVDGAKLGFPAESVAKVEAVRVAAKLALKIAEAAGVQVAYGTDLLGQTHAYQSDELKIRADASGNAQAIRSATSVAAAVLQMQGNLGIVQAGATADLLVIDGNPLADIGLLMGQGQHIKAIIKDGRFVKNEMVEAVPSHLKTMLQN
jgi:imidazolonepropionase-like amidohydrolase